MFPPPAVAELVARIAERLRASGATVAVSESACGGLVSACLVAVPGASEFFVGGATTYSLRSRLHLSGWSQDDILSYTGPSTNVALRLARNLKVELNATWTLAEEGWAGPPRPGAAEDVGTVYFGLAGPGLTRSAERRTGATERTANMEEFARLALEFLLSVLDEHALAELEKSS